MVYYLICTSSKGPSIRSSRCVAVVLSSIVRFIREQLKLAVVGVVSRSSSKCINSLIYPLSSFIGKPGTPTQYTTEIGCKATGKKVYAKASCRKSPLK